MKNNGIARTAVFCVIGMLIFLAPGVTAHAKEGPYLGLQIPFNNITGDFDNIKTPAVKRGAGVGFIAGYGFSPDVSMELDLARTNHKSAGANVSLTEFSLNGKYAFDASPRIKPFLFFGIGSFRLGDDNLMYGGTGYNAGVGMDYYSSSHLSWGIALIGKIIKYDRVIKGSKPASATGNINGETSSLRIDVSYHF